MAGYTGAVQGASKWAGQTPASVAFASSLKGELNFETNPIVQTGAGGQAVVGKGTNKVTLSLSEVVGLSATDAQLWFPTAAGSVVGSFPDFICTTGGQQWVLEDGQPGSGSLSMAEGDAFLLASLEAGFATATPATAAVTHAYASVAGETKNTIIAQLGGADFGCQAVTINNNGGWELINAMDTKTAGSLTAPVSVVHTADLPTVTAVLYAELDTAALLADAYTGANLVLSGALYTITVVNVAQAKFNGKIEDSKGVVGFSYDFTLTSGSIYNRVTIAAVGGS